MFAPLSGDHLSIQEELSALSVRNVLTARTVASKSHDSIGWALPECFSRKQPSYILKVQAVQYLQSNNKVTVSSYLHHSNSSSHSTIRIHTYGFRVLDTINKGLW